MEKIAKLKALASLILTEMDNKRSSKTPKELIKPKSFSIENEKLSNMKFSNKNQKKNNIKNSNEKNDETFATFEKSIFGFYRKIVLLVFEIRQQNINSNFDFVKKMKKVKFEVFENCSSLILQNFVKICINEELNC